MNHLLHADWISPSSDYETVCPYFKKQFSLLREVKSATLTVTALGVYEAYLNNQRVGNFVLAPGWTVYAKRLQYQQYDVTDLLQKENELTLVLGKGWYAGSILGKPDEYASDLQPGIIAACAVTYTDGTTELITTNKSWESAPSPILMSEIYAGETYDSLITPDNWSSVQVLNNTKDNLIPQEGVIVCEQEELPPKKLIITPSGERVLDFGQNLAGYVRIQVDFPSGTVLEYTHGESLDHEGNFYRGSLNYAQQHIKFTCSGQPQTYQPHFTFQGFRYVRLEAWPEEITINHFRAVVVHSDMKRTGCFECSHPMVNQLFQNVIWGQKSNFLDVPTDCPQRDERLGWSGDAQVFMRTATYNFDVEQFFRKWMRDIRVEQHADGGMPWVIPVTMTGANSAGWGDISTVCPWEVYLTYGDKTVLEDQYDSMCKWVNYIRQQGENEYLWNTGRHFGDWLNTDKPEDIDETSYFYLLATAFYAYSTQLLIKAGRILGKDITDYEQLLTGIKKAFNEEFIKDGRFTSHTQTAHALALHFDLVENKKEMAASLAELIKENRNRLSTGFLGTPYLLHALSENGQTELAYTLLFQEEYPSWLHPVKMGATTIWEWWDGIRPDGTINPKNSFNHYAYGAVADWLYGVVCGINTDENAPGFRHIFFRPQTDTRMDYAKASIDTAHGTVASAWEKVGDKIKYLFTVPKDCTATVLLGGNTYEVGEGVHEYNV